MVGRKKEIELLEKKYNSTESEFIAVYGRRRVGKTYLIRTQFENRLTFQFTGSANSTMQFQLMNFGLAIKEQYPQYEGKITSWIDAFQVLKTMIENHSASKKIIFIDELPWLDTKNSYFLQALEHFWNGWASLRKDVLLIVCGSTASWMINKLINHKGGLHNRITAKLKIEPFTLAECKEFITEKEFVLSDFQIIELYLVLGGIPFYWNTIEKGKSVFQLVQSICFDPNGLLRNEFTNVFKSLFLNGEKHEAIIEMIATKNKGLTREEIIKQTGLTNGGSLTRMLNELEESGFIRSYTAFGNKTKNTLYQLVDFYSAFYLKFIKPNLKQEVNWLSKIDTSEYLVWSGYAFEQLCLSHARQIKVALGIGGIDSSIYSWKSSQSTNGAQIDLVIDRKDKVINICEMKFSTLPYVLSKSDDLNLRNKLAIFKSETKTKKSLHLVMISPYGYLQNTYSALIQSSITIEDLFL
jgi:uncharacterized protein